ncbi:MAG: alpha/beta hydrolase [Polyangiaceae bacterium]|nr:alpha/beta hydrolase [Polyangiaceae bacterium]
MIQPRVDRTIQLRDFRKLAYAEWGDPDGRPLLFFHGTPSGRLFHHPDPAALEGLGVRFVTVDRPGYGSSDFLPRRSLLGWADDVVALTDHLGLERFSVAGLSGGGPHALACAYALPDRVRRAAVISGVGVTTPEAVRQLYPERRWGVRLSRSVPWLVPHLIALLGDPRDVERHYRKVLSQCPADRAVLERPEVRDMLQAGWGDANRSGTRAFAEDGRIFALPWGFDVARIRTTVRFWHGSADESVPIASARSLTDAIPGATLEVVDGAGHFLFFDHFRAIMSWAVDGA